MGGERLVRQYTNCASNRIQFALKVALIMPNACLGAFACILIIVKSIGRRHRAEYAMEYT